MEDQNLIITEDVKSAFADLLGRKTNDVSDIKIEGKHMNLHPNPVNNDNDRNNENNHPYHGTNSYPDRYINNNYNHHQIQSPSRINTDQSPFTSPISISSSKTNTSYYSPQNRIKSVSTSATPSRGSVLASYIQRFRNAPAVDPNRRKQMNSNTDFWWINNQKQKQQQRPNTAPNVASFNGNTTPNTVFRDITNSNINSNQLVVSRNIDENHSTQSSSIRSSISDEVQLLNSINNKPKQIEYKQNTVSNESHNSSHNSSHHSSPDKSHNISINSSINSSINCSPKQENIYKADDIEDENDEPDIPSPIQSSQDNDDSMMFSPTSSNDIDDEFERNEIIKNMNITMNNDDYNDDNIDVDDILAKWRKKRRLKQLASDNGMDNTHFNYTNDNNIDSNSINHLLNEHHDNNQELNRIKQRLGLLSNDVQLNEEQLNEDVDNIDLNMNDKTMNIESNPTTTTPTQPFTATIHPHPYQYMHHQYMQNPYYTNYAPQHNQMYTNYHSPNYMNHHMKSLVIHYFIP